MTPLPPVPGDSLMHMLQRARAGDDEAREAVITHACGRLERLARRMLDGEALIRRWAETGDVLVEALQRLHLALAKVPIKDETHFWRLAASEVRRILVELARKFRGRESFERNHWSDGAADDTGKPLARASGVEPHDLEDWERLHEAAGRLPEPLAEVFSLHFYHGLGHDGIAERLGVCDRTAKRYWLEAKLRLHGMLKEGG